MALRIDSSNAPGMPSRPRGVHRVIPDSAGPAPVRIREAAPATDALDPRALAAAIASHPYAALRAHGPIDRGAAAALLL